jgi:Ni,Fe-hydrogenase III small subunit
MLHILRQIAKCGIKTEPPPAPADEMVQLARLQKKILRVLGRALMIRQIDAGSCNGCELEIHALLNPYYNIEGLGIRFVASPRHADMLLVTGPVSKHMAIALRRTYDATPDPKLVVAVGDCGCSGGIFGESYASLGRVSNVIPVDVAIPGCPPAPVAMLQGILAAITVSAPGAQASPAGSTDGPVELPHESPTKSARESRVEPRLGSRAPEPPQSAAQNGTPAKGPDSP